MENLGYYNGRYAPLDEMCVPMNDRACYFGDGLYEVAYCRNYKIYALNEHMDRLYESARSIYIDIPITKEEFSDLLYELVAKLDSPDQIVYWQVSRGTQVRSHAPAEGIKANVWVTLRPMRIKDIYTPMRVMTAPDTRFYHCNMKTLNLLPNILATREAEGRGLDEAVLHRDGRVTECSHSNISIITDEGRVKTAPADNLILPGVARAHFIKACGALGIPVDETPFTVEEMKNAAEVVVTASGSLCRAVVEIDGEPVGGRQSELLRRVQDMILADYLEKTAP